jgi:hypothetical protein
MVQLFPGHNTSSLLKNRYFDFSLASDVLFSALVVAGSGSVMRLKA